MTDFTKLIFTSEADALVNVVKGSLSVTIPAGNLASTATVEYSDTADVGGAQFAQMLLGQDNIPVSGNSDISSASEYKYFNGSVQILVPANVPTMGADDETPARVYTNVSGDNIKLEVSVANPYPDTITLEETTITVYYFGYQAFQET